MGSIPQSLRRRMRSFSRRTSWSSGRSFRTNATTDRFEALPDVGPFIVKAEHADKGRWDRMFARTKVDAGRIRSELMADTGMRSQTIVARRYVPLAPLGDATIPGACPPSVEFRVFVAFGQVLSAAPYWPVDDCDPALVAKAPRAEDIPEAFLRAAIERLPSYLDYYTLDVALGADGRWWVIEVSDGLRAGMSENDPERVYAGLARVLQQRSA